MAIDAKTLAAKVKEMRDAQKEYFKARKARLDAVSTSWYSKARVLEAEVDKLVADTLAPATQPDLF